MPTRADKEKIHTLLCHHYRPSENVHMIIKKEQSMLVSYKKHHKKTSNLKRNQIPSSEIIRFYEQNRLFQ